LTEPPIFIGRQSCDPSVRQRSCASSPAILQPPTTSIPIRAHVSENPCVGLEVGNPGDAFVLLSSVGCAESSETLGIALGAVLGSRDSSAVGDDVLASLATEGAAEISSTLGIALGAVLG